MKEQIKKKSNEILKKLSNNSKLKSFIDDTYQIPDIFHGTGKIKLFILGQDPTVKNVKSRANIKTVLNLDKKRSIRKYIEDICSLLDINIEENVYATNYFKNFFIEPPTKVKEINIFEEYREHWQDLIKEELINFPDTPVITLGEPILQSIVKSRNSQKVRTYWGYDRNWKKGIQNDFVYINPENTHLDRKIFPFPHQPSRNKQFYKERLSKYTAYVKESMQ